MTTDGRSASHTSSALVSGTLLVNLLGVPERDEWDDLRAEILSAVESAAPNGVVLNLDQASVLDALDVAELERTGKVVQLMGRPMVLCGLRPEVLRGVVAAGVSLPRLRGFAAVQDALDAFREGSR